MKEQTIKVSLIVKAGDYVSAESYVAARLNQWFNEGPREAPFPAGTLLLWSYVEEPKDDVKPTEDMQVIDLHPTVSRSEATSTSWPTEDQVMDDVNGRVDDPAQHST